MTSLVGPSNIFTTLNNGFYVKSAVRPEQAVCHCTQCNFGSSCDDKNLDCTSLADPLSHFSSWRVGSCCMGNNWILKNYMPWFCASRVFYKDITRKAKFTGSNSNPVRRSIYSRDRFWFKLSSLQQTRCCSTIVYLPLWVDGY